MTLRPHWNGLRALKLQASAFLAHLLCGLAKGRGPIPCWPSLVSTPHRLPIAWLQHAVACISIPWPNANALCAEQPTIFADGMPGGMPGGGMPDMGGDAGGASSGPGPKIEEVD